MGRGWGVAMGYSLSGAYCWPRTAHRAVHGGAGQALPPQLRMRCLSYFSNHAFLLRRNSHYITILKSPLQWFSVYSQGGGNITMI